MARCGVFANEFWYYITFPLLLYGINRRTAVSSRICNGLIGLALVMVLPTEMMLLGSIWITGAIAHHAVAQQDLRSDYCSSCMHNFHLITVVTFLIVDRLHPRLLWDLLLGAGICRHVADFELPTVISESSITRLPELYQTSRIRCMRHISRCSHSFGLCSSRQQNGLLDR